MIEFVKRYIVMIVLSALVIVFVVVIGTDKKPEVSELSIVEEFSPSNHSPETTSSIIPKQSILVDVKGAVRFPGVYEMNEEDRVVDVIEKAGGFMEEAEQTVINLAQKVYDEMILIVPQQGEQSISQQISGTSKIRINMATAEEIQSLNGIGPSKAEAIIQFREEKGPFKTIEDLLNVSGIGEKTLEAIREDIRIP